MSRISFARALLLAGAGSVLPLPAVAAAGGSAPSPPAPFADTIYRAGHVLTLDDSVTGSAVAVRGERILWVGPAERLDAVRGPRTRVIDLGDAAVLPGFVDAHGHATFQALAVRTANVASPPVGPVTDIASLQAVLRAHAEANDLEPGDWIVGFGYDDSLLAERRHPDRDDLDAVSRDHPVALLHVSGHLATANSVALARVGLEAESPDPPGGLIRRRPDGREPNGVLEETATYPIRPFLFDPGDDPVALVEEALDVYASHGITTVQDGATGLDGLQLLRTAAAAERLDLDVIAFPLAQNEPNAVAAAIEAGRWDGRLRVGGIKLVLDGSPQGRTAFLSEPYHVPPEGQGAAYRGYPTLLPERVDALVARFLDARVPVIAHANGDAAADLLLDAVERAAPEWDHRTTMIHAQTVREDQLDRMRALGVIPSYFATHTFYWGDWHRDAVLGPVRGARISPARSTVARGMRFTVHNDAPIVPPDMIRLLWATVNRETRSGRVLGEAQRVDVLDALKAMTVHAAWQHFLEDDRGTLTPGKQADLVVLSENPLDVPREELLRLRVLRTISRGREVFREEGLEGSAPAAEPPGRGTARAGSK